MIISVPFGSDKYNALTIDEVREIEAEIHYGFAVFSLDVDEFSVTHVPSGGCITRTSTYAEAVDLCKKLDEVEFGSVPMAKLSPCELVEALPYLREIWSKVTGRNSALHGEEADICRKSWSEYLHCARTHPRKDFHAQHEL